ncbi:MAG: flagellar hook-length control protein FliK [Castellaniella sp.]|uniref:flagellar hook-length control protein FliK n=1 Tax=Castellaniella sp. TaxID=1955812 RepID=UPI002A35BD65|nr:flagellar hook-length control protein FliK [Castellaniella sp.]MDY0309535.1 flagellar hook-length control protein FliK [Castellaniella sp.]
MSIGAPSNLGTLLIQRLDAVLGTTLGQQANIASGAGPQAVPQPANPENPSALQNPTQRHPREAVDQASQQGRQQAAVGKAVRDMRLDNLLGRSTTFHGSTQSAPTTLGYAARIILALLNQFPHDGQAVRGRAPLLPNAGNTPPGGHMAGPPGSASTPTSAAPLPTQAGALSPSWAQLATSLGQPGALAARFAQALSQSIQTSGLFYESHLAQLASGKTTLQALRQEPQSRIPPQPAPGSLLQTPHPATPTSASPAAASSGAAPEATSAHTAAGQTQPQATTVPGIDPQLQLLVRQQLEVLANQAFIWQGEAWPGADMHWEVRRRPQDDTEDRDFQEDHWSTRLNLHLPTLGDVQARLSLSGDQLVMRLTAPQSADRLGQAIEPLRARLLAQGLRASQLSVQTHDDVPAAPEPNDRENETTAP